MASTLNGMLHTTTVPEKGMVATRAMWTDRHAGVIVDVLYFKSGKRAGQARSVVWMRDGATHAITFKVNVKGVFVANGDKLLIGVSDEYYDLHF